MKSTLNGSPASPQNNTASAAPRVDTDAALKRLKQGNERFLASPQASADLSPERIAHLSAHGQQPFAVVITCSDSRVVPEYLFNCGLGELFCIRTAGNVVGPAELASTVYAVAHLHVRLVVVLGHTGCGAIEAAMADEREAAVAAITDPIAQAIGNERDPHSASIKNVRTGVARLAGCPELFGHQDDDLRIIGALYHTDTGRVEFLD